LTADPRSTDPDDSRTAGSGACRGCRRSNLVQVLDLGDQPEANSFPPLDTSPGEDARFPLRVFLCTLCGLVQLDAGGPPEGALPGPPAYELSPTMYGHAAGFVDDALSRAPAALGGGRVVETASHGGYLAPFLSDRGVDSVVVEGTPSMVDAANARGHRVLARPFGREAAAELVAGGGQAALILDNYLLAHVEDPDDFAASLHILLAPEGRAILEFDHLLPLFVDRRFDSIRHGHYSYLSLIALSDLLGRHSLVVLDAVGQPVYGGALRIVVGHAGAAVPAPAVEEVLAAEHAAGLTDLAAYRAFASGVDALRSQLRGYLAAARDRGELVVGYGAPSRGNTLLNASGVTAELLPFSVDRSPLKWGRRMPGSGIPIRDPAAIDEARPAAVLILTWDIRDEVIATLGHVREWGGRFVVPMPKFEVVRG
jgi:hypothetical protein